MLELYKNYRRIYPKLRLSYSALRVYRTKRIWDYLTEKPFVSSHMERGKKLHKLVEAIDFYEGDLKKEYRFEKNMGEFLISGVVDLIIDNKKAVDYKFCNAVRSGHKRQLKIYLWALDLEVGELLYLDDEVNEKKRVKVSRDDSKIESSFIKAYENIINRIKDGELDEYLTKDLF